MAERKIDWGSSPDPIPERGNRFTVVAPLSGEPDMGWKWEFDRLLRQRKGEARGVSWAGWVEVREDEIRVSGVTKGSAKPLKEFLDEIVDRANDHSEERDRELREQAARAQSREDQQQSDAEELGRELRDG